MAVLHSVGRCMVQSGALDQADTCVARLVCRDWASGVPSLQLSDAGLVPRAEALYDQIRALATRHAAAVTVLPLHTANGVLMGRITGAGSSGMDEDTDEPDNRQDVALLLRVAAAGAPAGASGGGGAPCDLDAQCVLELICCGGPIRAELARLLRDSAASRALFGGKSVAVAMQTVYVPACGSDCWPRQAPSAGAYATPGNVAALLAACWAAAAYTMMCRRVRGSRVVRHAAVLSLELRLGRAGPTLCGIRDRYGCACRRQAQSQDPVCRTFFTASAVAGANLDEHHHVQAPAALMLSGGLQPQFVRDAFETLRCGLSAAAGAAQKAGRGAATRVAVAMSVSFGAFGDACHRHSDDIKCAVALLLRPDCGGTEAAVAAAPYDADVACWLLMVEADATAEPEDMPAFLRHLKTLRTAHDIRLHPGFVARLSEAYECIMYDQMPASTLALCRAEVVRCAGALVGMPSTFPLCQDLDVLDISCN